MPPAKGKVRANSREPFAGAGEVRVRANSREPCRPPRPQGPAGRQHGTPAGHRIARRATQESKRVGWLL
eukprot:scaffold27591_cov97-Isochrysis_galbana.AAC.1